MSDEARVTDAVVQPSPSATTQRNPSDHLLEVKDLFVEFHTRDGVARVINGVSLHLDRGETLAVLGESGSGKSVTALAIMGILDTPPALVRSGQVLYEREDLLAMSDDARREIRGRDIAMIFQDALSALNPIFPVGWQIAETLRRRAGLSKLDARHRALELMDRVRIPAAEARLSDYPHQFSGGMRQRVMIAMALALNPKVLIADEPTTALDVTVQAQIMDLIAELRREIDMAVILITHDLGVVAGVADRIAVMYSGRIVEHADVHSLYARPAHPYTRALIDSIPTLHQQGQPLTTIEGLPPNLLRIPPGCPFHPRCRYTQSLCTAELPAQVTLEGGRTSACHFAREVLDDRP